MVNIVGLRAEVTVELVRMVDAWAAGVSRTV